MADRVLTYLRVLATLLFYCAMHPTYAAETQLVRDGEEQAQTAAIVTFGFVAPVLQRVLLIRAKDGVCALRFSSYERAHDAKPGTAFNTGDETFAAEYEWAFYSKTGSVKSGRHKVSRGAIIGIGRVIVPSTSARIECGPIKGLAWSYPLYVSMYIDSKRSADGLQFTPTSCLDLSAAKSTAASYTWYKYEEDRATLYIRASELKCLEAPN